MRGSAKEKEHRRIVPALGPEEARQEHKQTMPQYRGTDRCVIPDMKTSGLAQVTQWYSEHSHNIQLSSQSSIYPKRLSETIPFE